MKKFLTMALALVMILSLFAVPTMAATIEIDLFKNGSFDNIAAGTALGSTVSADAFSAGSNGAGTIVNIAGEGIAANGNSVNALRIANTKHKEEPYILSNTFSVSANTVYTLSFDYLIVEPSKVSVGYGVRLGDNSADYGQACYNNTTGKKGSHQLYYPTALPEEEKTDANYYVTNTWANFTCTMSSTVARENESVYFYIWNQLNSQEAMGPIFYIDNVSFTATVEGATVTKTATGNGTITSIDDAVELGTTQSIVLTPATGNFLESLTLNGVDVMDSLTTVWDNNLKTFVSTYTGVISADTAVVAKFTPYYTSTVVDEDMEDIDYDITTGGNTGDWWVGSNSSAAVVTSTDPANATKVISLTSGDVAHPSYEYEVGLYKLTYDAKANTNGTIRLQHTKAYGDGSAQWDGTTAGAWYPEVTDEWASYEIYLNLSKLINADLVYGQDPQISSIRFQVNGAVTSFELDNVVVTKYSKTASAPVEPTTAAVTISGDNAVVSVADATVEVGGSTTFTVAPTFGYYIAGITVGGTEFAGFDAYKGDTYTVADIAADTAIVVTTAAFADGGDSAVSSDVATLPATFAPAADTAVTFGKVLDTTDATSWGIELTKDGVGVTPANGGSYLYKANATNANGQYAIEFVGLESGTYTIRSYVYVNGTATFGAPATFVVE